MITRQTIEKIFDAVRIEEVIGDFVNLKKSGSNYKGLSPFANEKTPSFMVSPVKQIFKDFSSGKGGNAVTFLMEHEHLTYPDALRYLAKKYNIEIEEEAVTPEAQQEASERESLYIVNDFAENYFIDQLLNTDEGKNIGLSYFKERGFTDETIKLFKLGYSPNGRDAFTQAALSKGHKLQFLEKTGLTIVKEDRKYDRFWGRVMFPIHNLSGRVLGFGGRVLKKDEKTAKYLNSPESDIYHKSKVLYGVYQAKKAIVKEDNCLLVEGYTDVISLFQNGIENVVASSGTALTEDQVRLIKRFTSNITILYDGDPAGIKASFRGINLILEQGMNVKVLLFPEGDDPDSFARKNDTETTKKYLEENAKDFIRFKISVLFDEAKDDPIKRSEFIHDIAESVALIPDHIKRSVYISECSKLLEISEQAVLAEVNKLRKDIRTKKARDQRNYEEAPLQIQSPQKQAEEIQVDKLNYRESELLRIMLSYSDKEFDLPGKDEEGKPIKEKANVLEFLLNDIHHDGIEFKNEIHQKVLNEIMTQFQHQEIFGQQFFFNHPDQSIAQFCIDLVTSKYSLSENWEKHNIWVTTEEMNLSKAVLQTLYFFKLHKLEERIIKQEEKLKLANQDESTLLIQEIKIMRSIIRQLCDYLGIVVLG